jgi:HK97 family phage portal protein
MGRINDWWYNFKMNRSQARIQSDEGEQKDSTRKDTYFKRAYDRIEIIRRGTDLLVDSAAEINYSVLNKINGVDSKYVPLGNETSQMVRKKKVETLLNFQANPEVPQDQFRREVFMDLVINGNAYMYFDGNSLYHLPAHLMEIFTGEKQRVKYYLYDSKDRYTTAEIIHIKENAADSIYQGVSRLFPAQGSIDTLDLMLGFQELFFENGTVPGLVLTTPNILNAKIKNRILENWRRSYSPKSGARRPLILDGDFKLNPLSDMKWRELDFETSVSGHEEKILKALGVPPILLNSGNNANLTPNLKLFYLTAVLPLVRKFVSACEYYFAYDMKPDTVGVPALQPEMNEETQQLTGLVNAGIITVNEAREQKRLPPAPEEHADELRIPANIAGSATDPSQGGRPPGSDEDSDSNEEENNEED